MKKAILTYTLLAIFVCCRVCISQPMGTFQNSFENSKQVKKVTEWISIEFGQYNAFTKHLKTLVKHKNSQSNNSIITLLDAQGLRVVEYTEEDLIQYFQSCLEDKLTNLRALSIISCLSRKMNTVYYINGELIRDVMAKLNINPGLCLPITNLKCMVMIPDAKKVVNNTNYQCKLISIYKRKFTHMFPKEIIDINLKVGVGETIVLDDIDKAKPESLTAYLVKGDMIYSKTNVGIVNVEGVAGVKQEFAGKFQKVFSFIPDFIKSMTIKPSGDLVAETIINETVKDFENKTKYQIHRYGILAWERDWSSPSEK